ncbi:HD domain-containing protein [Clostridium sp. YIM B02515]|uniref:HD domain-containing protein n=1 Tax=Clostridium rhizosphaerae TaxID=2803861 RepID=A0ABS1TCQ8_9CLOT|nr:HD domain-containing protein [Clostridium rhizosphaerae]MBL4937134.1 HD domain-containing protein [Clostridium rhizosphaerae]
MKLVIVSDKILNEVLASPIYTETEIMFLNKGNRLTENAIKRLKKMSITSIYIEDGNDEMSLQEVLPTANKLSALKIMKELLEEIKSKNYVDDKKVYDIIKEILQNINLSENAVLLNNLAPNDDLSKLGVHSIDITILAAMVGNRKKYDEKKLLNLTVSALLHDIGKLFTSKNNHVDTAYNLVKKNVVFGATIYVSIRQLYEREDGQGPLGLIGENIYEFAKIINICNEYLEIINNEKGILPHMAIEKIAAEGAARFSADIYRDFVQSIYCYPNGLPVKLSNNLYGIVIMQNKDNPTRPIIAVRQDNNYNFCNLQEKLTLFISDVIL